MVSKFSTAFLPIMRIVPISSGMYLLKNASRMFYGREQEITEYEHSRQDGNEIVSYLAYYNTKRLHSPLEYLSPTPARLD